ncbi:ABC transporter ATP-binding protein [Pisciglobus halotolerans]|uniref:Putative ABC transport system ATP-binding protein n=1 Tax=Pisciglobus halotolerans TaxID=745365 RepID=A0A1I3BAZ1_9LACT|nr:ATP-binding cassette domain-containing protein [Pisciglobus halotolerans]SFH59487.1 putative ABC transport system ATP-binding protein [Pisciglobus halotolerans]
MSVNTILDIQGLSKTYQQKTLNEHQVLKELSFQVNKGDFITVIGGNGSGKSSLLNAIAGSSIPDKGKILLSGKDITRLKEEQRADQIGRVFQDPLMGTAPRMTVAENLAIAFRRGKKRRFRRGITANEKELYMDLLAKLGLGLERRLDSEMGLLSGGQRQAITLLMATMKKPAILLLDEHTAALDPKTAQTILSLTSQRIKEEKLTALMITHNMQDALTYGNRLLMLDSGKIVMDLSQEEKESLTAESLILLFQQHSLGFDLSS